MKWLLSKKMKFAKNQKGLTLVELLAVIVILGVIAAIAVPSIGGIISNSKTKADAQTETILRDTAVMYMSHVDPDGDGKDSGSAAISGYANAAITVDALVSAGYLKIAPKKQSETGTANTYSSIPVSFSNGWTSTGTITLG